jgi:hypothetical protein
MHRLLRDSPAEFAALIDASSSSRGIAREAIEKDYWAMEVLRSACGFSKDVHSLVFKGGTSLSKAFGLIHRFSEDIDLLVVSGESGAALKRTFRRLANHVSTELGLPYEREREGRGYLNARFAYQGSEAPSFLSNGVLLEVGSRGGATPSEARIVRSLLSEAASLVDPSIEEEFADLCQFSVNVLAPERTLAEKLAHLHHRAVIGDMDALRRGARHLYDVAMLLRSEDVLRALSGGSIVELMNDIDMRSAAAGWGFTPRPVEGFAASPAFRAAPRVVEAYEGGFDDLTELVWGDFPTVEEALHIVSSRADLL